MTGDKIDFLNALKNRMELFLNHITGRAIPSRTDESDLKTLLVMSQNIVALEDTDQVLSFLLGEICKAFTLECGVIMPDDDGFFRVRSHRGFSADFAGNFKAILGEGATGECFSFNKLRVLKKEELSKTPDFSTWATALDWNTMLLAPLSLQNQISGVFLAGSKNGNSFRETEISAMDPYLQILSLGIRNAQIFERIEKFNRRLEAEVSSTTEELTRTNARLIRRVQDLKTLYDISEAFYATPVLEFVLGKIVKIIIKSLSCDTCSFMFFDPSSEELVAHPGESSLQGSGRKSPEDENSIALEVFRQGVSRIVDDIHPEEPGQDRIHSMMFVVLKVEKELIGVLKLGCRVKSFFSPDHLKLTELIADRASVIVQNARLYQNIMLANKELERLNRVKTEFVSMVSHELRTPVTAIKGFVDVVMNEEAGPINDQQKRFLKIAHNSIDRLTLLISDLLDLSRIEAGQLKIEVSEIEAEKVLRESFETYRASMETKKIDFSLELEKKLPRILADEPRIKQVIDNLISNAMKFTPSGGRIRMIAEDMGDFILVSVSDTGTGIKKEDHERIFEKFYQVDSSLTRAVGGTGLGLAISKSIMEMHAGRIWVESELGKGSTFRILLPRARQTASEGLPEDFRAAGRAGKDKAERK